MTTTTTNPDYEAEVESAGLNLEAFRTYLNNEWRDIDENWEDYQEDFTDAYVGEFESNRDFVEHIVEDTMFLVGVDEKVARYFDYDSFCRDLLLGGEYWESNNYYFRSY